MPAALTLPPRDAETRTELEHRDNTTTDADTRLRYHIILLATQGYTAPQIAGFLLRSDDMVLQVLKRFRAGGLDAVPRRYAPGRARTVTPEWEAALLRVIECDPHEVGVQSANLDHRPLSRVPGPRRGHHRRSRDGDRTVPADVMHWPRSPLPFWAWAPVLTGGSGCQPPDVR